MTLAVKLDPSLLPDLLRLFSTAGERTRLRLAPHLLAHADVPLDVLLDLFSMASAERWHEHRLHGLERRLALHAADPRLFDAMIAAVPGSNDMQRRIAFHALVAIGRDEAVPHVLPWMASSTAWVGWPAIRLVGALAGRSHLCAIVDVRESGGNANEHMGARPWTS